MCIRDSLVLRDLPYGSLVDITRHDDIGQLRASVNPAMDDAGFLSLEEGEKGTDTFTITIFDENDDKTVNSVSDTFSITYTGQNDAPTGTIAVSGTQIRLDSGETSDVVDLGLDVSGATDPEGHAIRYEVDDNRFFVDTNGNLFVKRGVEFAEDGVLTITITAVDTSGVSGVETEYEILVGDPIPGTAPTLTLSTDASRADGASPNGATFTVVQSNAYNGEEFELAEFGDAENETANADLAITINYINAAGEKAEEVTIAANDSVEIADLAFGGYIFIERDDANGILKGTFAPLSATANAFTALDAGEEGHETFTITVTDRHQDLEGNTDPGGNSVSKTFTVTYIGVDDAPEFGADSRFDLSATADGTGTPVEVGTVTATDAENHAIAFTFANDTGADGDYRISESGLITYVGGTGATTRTLEVKATANSLSVTKTIEINVASSTALPPAAPAPGIVYEATDEADVFSLDTAARALTVVKGFDPAEDRVEIDTETGTETTIAEITALEVYATDQGVVLSLSLIHI